MAGHPLDQQVRETVAQAYEKSPAMRNRLDAAGLKPADIQSVDDLARIPVITKDTIIKLQAADPPFGGMLGVPQSRLAWIFISPGPIYEAISDVDAYTRVMASMLQRLGITQGDVVLNTLSYHLVPVGLVFDHASRALGATVLPTGVGNTELQVKMMLDLRATAFIGTPSFLLAIIKKAEELGVNFAQALLKKAIVTAEPLTPSARASLEGYGISLANLYGTAELGVLGYETQGGCGFTVPDDKVVQICSPETGSPLPDGEIGEIVASVLNPDFPLIRVGTGDLSIMAREAGPCGAQPRLLGWMGRSGEAVKVRGMFVHPNQIRLVLSRFAEVERYQAVITRPEQRDELTLRIVSSQPTIDEVALSEALQGVLRVRPDRVEIVTAEQIQENAPVLLDERTWN